MNNPSPLIPQGSLLDQKNRSRARVKIAVFFVLAIHGIGLLALLMQGCRREEPVASAQPEATNNPAVPTFDATNVPAPDTNAIVAAAPPAAETTNAAPPAAAAASEYSIAKGDTFSTIATHFHVSVKALIDANPGVEPTRLKIGQKIQIPPPTTISGGGSAAGPAGAPAAESGSGEVIYTVKSGDTLIKIAGHYGVTVKAIRAANDLKTDSIKVGQKLKIPAKAAAPAPTNTGAAPTAALTR